MLLPLIPEIPQERSYINEFRGLNRHDRIGEGEFYDVCNMSNDEYPALVTRKKRWLAKPTYHKILSMEYVGTSLYVLEKKANGNLCMHGGSKGPVVLGPEVDNDHGYSLTFGTHTSVNGLHIFVFPEMVYYDTTDDAWYPMKTRYRMPRKGYEPDSSARLTFTAVDELFTPVSDLNGASAQFVKISADGRQGGHDLANFHINDTVHIGAYGSGAPEQIRSAKFGENILQASATYEDGYGWGGYIIVSVEDFYSTEVTFTDASFSGQSYFRISRDIPDVDLAIAHNNAIYGACFSIGGDDGDLARTVISEIYISSGADVFDFTSGATSLTIGETGYFTGLRSFGGNVYAFKETCAIRISGNPATGYATTTLRVPGVAFGSHRSIAEWKGYLFYCGDRGVYRFNGEYAEHISAELGDMKLTNASGCVFDNRYIITAQISSEAFPTPTWRTLSYDLNRGFWLLMDGDDVVFAKRGNNLVAWGETYGLTTVEKPTKEDWLLCGYVLIVDPMSEEPPEPLPDAPPFDQEDDFDWWCEFGAQGYETPDEKYVSRILIRMRMEPGTVVRVYMQYDNETSWGGPVAAIEDAGIRTVVVPVIPQRCDVYRMRIEGHGACRIYGITKTLEGGSDIQWHT